MKDIKQLHPKLQKLIPCFIEECANKGLKIGIGECFRSTAEQNALYAMGRTKPGSIVTNAKGTSYQSCHQWGIAFDFFRDDGKKAYDDSNDFFRKVGKVGKSMGLAWGGDWNNFKDKPHLQLSEFSPDGTADWLKQKYKTPAKFIKTWK